MVKSGFSLIEILIVLVLLGFLSLSTFSAVRSTIQNKEAIDRRVEILQEGRAALSIIERDIMAAYYLVPEDLGWAPLPPHKPGEPEIPPAVKPLPVTIFKGQAGEIFFSTRTHRRTAIDSPENESHFVTYQLSSGNLVRATSQRVVSAKDRENSEKFDTEILLENVKKFKLSYFDVKSEDWLESWDTEKRELADRLPEAVRIELEYEPLVNLGFKQKPQDVVLKTEFNIAETLLKSWEIAK